MAQTSDWDGMLPEPLTDERLEWLEESAKLGGLDWLDAAALFGEIDRLKAELTVSEEALGMAQYSYEAVTDALVAELAHGMMVRGKGEEPHGN